jgi:hypothetical protein
VYSKSVPPLPSCPVFWSAVGGLDVSLQTMKRIILICIALLSQTSFGGEFDNWYFKFHSQSVKISGTRSSPNDEILGRFSGTSSGEVSEDGAKFTESFRYKYMPEDKESKFEVVWTEAEDGVYCGTCKMSKEVVFFHELVVKDDLTYRLKSTLPDGTIIESEGRLGEDMILTAQDVAKNKEGSVVGKMHYRRSKVAPADKAPKG